MKRNKIENRLEVIKDLMSDVLFNLDYEEITDLGKSFFDNIILDKAKHTYTEILELLYDLKEGK